MSTMQSTAGSPTGASDSSSEPLPSHGHSTTASEPTPNTFVEPSWASLETGTTGAPVSGEPARHAAAQEPASTSTAAPPSYAPSSSYEPSYYQVSMPAPGYPTQPEAPAESSLAAPPSKSRRRWVVAAIIVGALGAAGVLASSVIGNDLDPSDSGLISIGPNRIEAALDGCNLMGRPGASVGDEGATVTLDTKGEEDISGISFQNLECMISALDIPDAIESRILATRALDGVQSGTYDDVSLSWSYHPDDGMTLIVSLD